MLKNLKTFLYAVPLLLLSVTASHAVVQLVDIESTGTRIDIDVDVTQGVIATGSGFPGDFELLMCSTYSDGNNTFLDPVPDSWSTLDEGECGGNEQCILGIYGRFDGSPDSTDITCSWTDPTDAFAAGAFRYRGVDPDNPVIDVACNTGGPNELITAPSVITESRSAVIRVITLGFNVFQNPVVEPDQVFEGVFTALGINSQSGEFVLTIGESFLFLEGGPTGDLIVGSVPADWRACTIALRMAPTNIPTLSEWGMLAAAAGLMLVGVFFAVRRRRAARV
ncbi:MAG: hypothetical protein AB1598_14370 [Thermodesulfobacteriota bacterium]